MKHIVMASAVLFMVSCGSKEVKKETKQPLKENVVELNEAQQKNADIVTGKAEQKTIAGTIKLNGQIDVPPQNLVSVSFPLGGYLKSTQLMPGLKITKGQSIAVLEDQQFIQIQQEYLSAKARDAYLSNEFNRQRELNIAKASSDKVYQQIVAEYKENTIKIKALAEKLLLIGVNPSTLNENNLSREVRISAPISGFVSKVNVNIGKYVNPTDVLFEIVNPDDIHLRLSVFEKDLPSLSIGQKVTAWTANEPDVHYDCEIVLISRDVAADRSMDVHCHFLKSSKDLVPGMYMIGEVAVQNSSALAVPADAVVHYQNNNFVFLAKGPGSYEMTPVTPGNTQDGYTQISSNKIDLSQKELVLKNAYTLLMKLKNSTEE